MVKEKRCRDSHVHDTRRARDSAHIRMKLGCLSRRLNAKRSSNPECAQMSVKSGTPRGWLHAAMPSNHIHSAHPTVSLKTTLLITIYLSPVSRHLNGQANSHKSQSHANSV